MWICCGSMEYGHVWLFTTIYGPHLYSSRQSSMGLFYLHVCVCMPLNVYINCVLCGCSQRPENGVGSMMAWMLILKLLCSARTVSTVNHCTIFPSPSSRNLIKDLRLYILDHCPLNLMRKTQIPILSRDQNSQANSKYTVAICQIVP